MAISFDDIENAFLFVSMGQQYMHNADLCKDTGQIFYTSEMGDSDELPEDINDPDKYITISHQNDLELGRALVFEFVSRYLPDELDRVDSMFRSRGAYLRYKHLLDKKGLLDKWHEFEDERKKQALKQWCLENNIELKG
jgi:hypothetical protein